MTPSGQRALRYGKAALLLLFITLSVSSLQAFWRTLHPTLTPSEHEDQLDQESVRVLAERYRTTVQQSFQEKSPEKCSSLPEIFLPYHRSPSGHIVFTKSQSDGPTVPERESYWPRKQCLFAFALEKDPSVCNRFFFSVEEQADCSAAIHTPPPHRYQELMPLSPTEQQYLGKKSFSTDTGKKTLPYYILYPTKPVQGIVLYLHGAGGGFEQGQLDGTYKDSFKKLKLLLKDDLGYAYVTPALRSFGQEGGQDALHIAEDLHRRFPDVPLYLAGSSAGGRTLFYALQAAPAGTFAGAIALCPAIDTRIQHFTSADLHDTPVWISHGTEDPLVPFSIVDEFVKKLRSQNHPIAYLPLPGGDHGAPIDQIDWRSALTSF